MRLLEVRADRSGLPRDRRPRRHRAPRRRRARAREPGRARAAAALGHGARRHGRGGAAQRRAPDARVPRRAAGRLLLRADQLPADRRRRSRTSSATPTRRRSSATSASPTLAARRPTRPASRPTHRLAHGTIPGFRSFDELVDRAADDAARRPLDRRGDALHVGHHRPAQGREAPAHRASTPTRAPSCSRSCLLISASRRGDGNVHLSTSPNYHTAVTTFAGNALHIEAHRRVHGQVGPGGDAAAHRAVRLHAHAHGADAVHPHAAAARRRASAKYDVSSMKWAIHAAAPCPVDVKRKMLEWWGPVIWEYYAATEGGGTIAPPDEWLKYPGTVGRVWPTCELKITDDDGNVHADRRARHRVDADGRGRLRVQGRQGEDRTSRTTPRASSPSATSATSTRTGYLFLCDRKSDMIIAGGVNIYPAEIEGVHPRAPAGRRRRGVRHPRRRHGRADQGGRRAVARRRGRRRAARVDHGARAAAGSASTSGRAAIDFIDELPREPTGKLLKRKLRDPYWEGRDRAI